ncbi:hypothetical protein [Sulfurospirillum oryzae]|uniref:hypothetical protein n=1 Tax=Sulfurospirillum oryzae TaxID=2976535 RepID=UPI0021E96765|nr:hypothetical protein [Sulfurospirillum oryzae]
MYKYHEVMKASFANYHHSYNKNGYRVVDGIGRLTAKNNSLMDYFDIDNIHDINDSAFIIFVEILNGEYHCHGIPIGKRFENDLMDIIANTVDLYTTLPNLFTLQNNQKYIDMIPRPKIYLVFKIDKIDALITIQALYNKIKKSFSTIPIEFASIPIQYDKFR